MSTTEYFDIPDEKMDSFDFKDKVVVITGGSSGIGFATATLFSSKGAQVVTADVNPPLSSIPNTTFIHTDVTSWSGLIALFEKAVSLHGHIDHVIANAGISPTANFLSLKLDADGKPLQPDEALISVNLHGAINTATLGLHYIKQTGKGSVIITASSASYYYHVAPDYSLSKSAVVGYMRGIVPLLYAQYPDIRINCVAPHYTDTAMAPPGLLQKMGIKAQPAEAVAKSILLCCGDESMTGVSIFSRGGRYKEINRPITQLGGDLMDIPFKGVEEAWKSLGALVSRAKGTGLMKEAGVEE